MTGVTDELLARGRVLIVDDEPANVRLLERMLLTGGFTEVRCVTDPREALAAYDELQPDIVMLDLHMPFLDGYAVLQLLRDRIAPGEYLPILVLTADTTREAKERALSGGARDFLTKPLERTEVLLRTRNLLETRFLHLALREENRGLEAKLVHQAFHDALTGLANRALFRDRAQHALSRSARGERHCVLLVDLDDFKSVNDTFGHAAGDRVLEVTAERLLRATRGCDTVARIGGDEFAVLLEDIGTDADALVVVDRIQSAIRHPIEVENRVAIVGSSIGVAHPRSGERIDELLRNADVAMYRAKDDGKGRHVVFEPEMYTELLQRMELESDLRGALDRKEFRVVYQPIVELGTSAIVGLEALVRWDHRDGTPRSPATFIALAEETGLIVPIGRWVLHEACRQGRAWLGVAALGEVPTMSVNVSARQLMDPAFAEFTASVLEETKFPANRLILEITESVVMSNDRAAIEQLHALRSLGVRLAIDDFGTGYCNLSYLQAFPVDVLKIDRSFVTNVASNGGDAALASSIVSLATTLRLRTIAEGVEDAAQRDHLLALGCTHGQGYLFARPVGADEVAALLRSGVGTPTPPSQVAQR
jgi:diguanylate cyclase (GGDEF)-like protein